MQTDPVRAIERQNTPPPPKRLITPGRLLPKKVGRYTLFSHIGRGGMADIYLASAESELGARRLVVIKEVLPDLAHNTHFADMLVAEAKLAARLDHANVVKVEHLDRDGSLYIAMEYVEGVDLREMLRRCAKSKIPLPVEFSLRIVIEVLRGLRFAHRFRGDDGARLPIVHRDVSPSNVLLSFEGEVKVCDFGIARANALADSVPAEAIQGKAGYMSPEQARGDAIDPRADVFATGIILWELLSGRRLYKAQPGEKLIEVARRAEVPDLPERGLPHEDELHAIVRRALERDPEARTPSADVMSTELEEYAVRSGLVASPLRLGAWLSEHFAAEVVDPRRAGERAMRALARGPAAVLEPIEPVTPSTFMVVERDLEAPAPVVPSPVVPSPVLMATKSSKPKQRDSSHALLPAPRTERSVLWYMIAAAIFLMLLGTAWHAFAGY